MSKIKIELNENQLFIQCERTRMTELDTQVIDITDLVYGQKNTSYVRTHKKKDTNRILFWKEMEVTLKDKRPIPEEDTKVLFVVAVGGVIYYGYMDAVRVYKLMVNFIYKVLHVSFHRNKLHVYMLSYLTKQHKDIEVERIFCGIDEKNSVPVTLNVYKNRISKIKLLTEHNFQHIQFSLKDLLTDETTNNNMLNMLVRINGVDLDFRIGKKDKGVDDIRKYYAPYESCYVDGYAIHLRRTDRGNFAVVKRPMEKIEQTWKFRFFESRVVSFVLYHVGKLAAKKSKKKVNLFYEKFSEKAEEGAYDLFCMAKNTSSSKNYFIIDEHAADYERIKQEKNVVKKYSMQYYWLIYRVNNYIATEAPAHLNILRSNNKYFRLSTCEHPFIFLQHGVTYLKCQGESSTFVKGKEGEPAYMVVGSKKEKDAVCDMLRLTEEQVLNTGLPIFSKIEYEHINNASPDKVVIMLTWKSYEEHIREFENSQYYQNVMAVYHMLENYIPSENIIIVAHPKMAELCKNTSLSETMWKKPISEVLGIAKLLITDYSSVCYNSFYQGGSVIFYQPDLELFEREAGPLIPSEDEYIGNRVFHISELEAIIRDTVHDGKINLDELRKKEYVEQYHTINEFHDGKNIERIRDQLLKLEII